MAAKWLPEQVAAKPKIRMYVKCSLSVFVFSLDLFFVVYVAACVFIFCACSLFFNVCFLHVFFVVVFLFVRFVASSLIVSIHRISLGPANIRVDKPCKLCPNVLFLAESASIIRLQKIGSNMF